VPNRPPAREVYRKLLASSIRGRKPKVLSRDRIIKGRNGDLLFRIRQRSTSIALILPMHTTSASCLERIQAAVAQIMDGRALDERPLVVRRDETRAAEKTGGVAGSVAS
jgi:hypothetical protein